MELIDEQFLKKYNQKGPRYTSYPPAPFFHSAYTPSVYVEDVKASNNLEPQNISIYIHIPFCPQLCTFCGCTTYTGAKKPLIERYIDALEKEINYVAQFIDKNRLLTQVHWGGGTPNSIPYKYIERISDCLKKNFTWAEHYEMAIECSPAYLSLKQVEQLASFGFNRISLGVQDTKQEVLDAINRKGPKHKLSDLIACIRQNHFKSVNIDLVYGLPYQTPSGFEETLSEIIALNPDRIVTFSYAHIPQVMARQKMIDEQALPKPGDKLKMYNKAYNMLLGAGYEAIGMDHFSKPKDEIALAFKAHQLHRNFQGYCTRETTGQVYGFGASSISQLASSYAQNDKRIANYIDLIEKQGLAIEKGYQLSEEEQITRSIINELMCNYYLDFREVAALYGSTVEALKAISVYSEEKFSSFVSDGLMLIKGDIVEIPIKGRAVVRNIAMLFDPKLKQSKNAFSQTV